MGATGANIPEPLAKAMERILEHAQSQSSPPEAEFPEFAEWLGRAVSHVGSVLDQTRSDHDDALVEYAACLIQYRIALIHEKSLRTEVVEERVARAMLATWNNADLGLDVAA